MTFAFLLLAALPAQSDALAGLLTRMDQAASTFRGLSAKVRRVAHNGVINDDSIETGTVLVKRSRSRELRMLIELTEPDQKAAAFSGHKFELYFPKIQTVQEFDAGKNRILEQFFLLGFGTSRRELEGEYSTRVLGAATINGQAATHLELIPKSEKVLQHIKKVELWVSDANGYPLQQKFAQSGGDYQLVTYSDLKINPDLPDSRLKLNLPKGVKREYPQR